MSVITSLRKARPYLTAPFRSDDENSPLTISPPDRMSGVASSPPQAPSIQPRAASVPTAQPENDYDKIWNLGGGDTSQPPATSVTPITHGKPLPNPSIQDPQTRLTDYETQLVNYQPQKEGVGKILGRAALGFVAHGLPGVAYSVGSDLMDRKALDRHWQEQELGKTEGTIQRLDQQKRIGLQDQLTQSEIDKNKAAINKPTPESQTRHKLTVPDDRYKQFGINAGDKIWGDVNGSPLMQNNQPVLSDRAPAKPVTSRPIETRTKIENGVTYQTEYDPEKKTWIKSLDDQGQPITVKTADVVPNVPAQNAPDIKTINDRLQANLKELRQHQDEIATKNAAIKKQGEAGYQAALGEYNKAVANGEKPAKPQRKDYYERAQNNDPDYLDGTVEKVKNRIVELKTSNTKDQSDLEGLQRENRKAIQKPRKSNAVSVASSVNEQQIRDAAKAKGLDPDKAVQRAKSRGILR